MIFEMTQRKLGKLQHLGLNQVRLKAQLIEMQGFIYMWDGCMTRA